MQVGGHRWPQQGVRAAGRKGWECSRRAAGFRRSGGSSSRGSTDGGCPHWLACRQQRLHGPYHSPHLLELLEYVGHLWISVLCMQACEQGRGGSSCQWLCSSTQQRRVNGVGGASAEFSGPWAAISPLPPLSVSRPAMEVYGLPPRTWRSAEVG